MLLFPKCSICRKDLQLNIEYYNGIPTIEYSCPIHGVDFVYVKTYTSNTTGNYNYRGDYYEKFIREKT